MNPVFAAWVAGYRLGHDGLPPALSAPQLEQELSDIESEKPPAEGAVDTIDHDWFWHLQGWAVGQAMAQHQIGML